MWVWIALTVVITALAATVVGLVLDRLSGDDDPPAAAPASASPTDRNKKADRSADEDDVAEDEGERLQAGGVKPTKRSLVAPAPSHIGDVADLGPGLFCRDLNARGYSYSASVEYWRLEGHTNRMDADRNGIPCETVYPRSDVVAYWGDAGWSEPGYTHIYDMPGGLFCKDLAARGYSYGDAVTYWFREGAPDRMDADLNGIPCETVYPAYVVEDYWGM